MQRPSRPPTSASPARSPWAGRRPSVAGARRHPTGRAIVAAVAVTLALGAASCGSDEPIADPPPTTVGTSTPSTQPPSSAAPTSTTTAASGDDAEVRAVIDRYWPAFLEATTNADPDNPDLQAVLTGEASARIIGSIEDLKNAGQRVVVPEGSVFSHQVTSLTFDGPDRAIVEECVIDDLVIVDAAGAPVNDAVTTSEYTSTLNRTDGGWRIGKRERTKRVEGIHECSVLV